MGKARLQQFLTVISAAIVLGLLAPAKPSAAEAVNYRLKWILNSSVVGDLYADVHGHFRAENLEVTVKAGGPERDAIKELELGLAEYGAASADQVIRALSKGSPVVVIAQLFQINPLQWIYRDSDPAITELSHLRGKTIGVTFGGNDEAILRTLLGKAGLTEADVKLFSVRYDYTPFYQRRVDIWPVYRNTQAVFLSRKLGEEGEVLRFFNPVRFGVQFVANSVVTSRKRAAEHPDQVRRFVTALLKGWRDALDPVNQGRALEVLRKFDRDTDPEVIREQLEETRRLILPSPDVKLGSFDYAAWRQTEKIMLEQEQIPHPVVVENALMPEFAFGPNASPVRSGGD
ncbi:MAG: ABC transporter substrate-binding protein [Desulfobacterales bacterium]